MTKEIVTLISQMDVKAAETQMALRCAPLIVGLKPSNLLIVQRRQAGRVKNLINHTKISCHVLFQGGQKSVLLLYRRQFLCCYLEQAGVRRLLWQAGYHDFAFPALLDALAVRYAAYMCGRAEFPHEMGLFLGYPLEDVQGFIENHGKNCLCTGYWKVYEDREQKLLMFQLFEQAQELLIQLLARGISMSDVLGIA